MKLIRYGFLAGFLFTAIYHVVGMILPESVEPSSFERHLVFVLINSLSAFLLYWNRPKPLLLFTPLIAQQLWSHGIYGWKVWTEQSRIDWASVFVLIGMPILAVYVWKSLQNSLKQKL